MKTAAVVLLTALATLAAAPSMARAEAAAAQTAQSNTIERINASEQGGDVVVRLQLAQPLKAVPPSFTVASPARIAMDFAETASATGQVNQNFNIGDLQSASLVQVGTRTRLVLNLARMVPYETQLDGKALRVVLKPAVSAGAPAGMVTRFAESAPGDAGHSIRDVNFRRGADGEGRVVVDLSDANTGIDIRQQGTTLVVDFDRTAAPDAVLRTLDVTDFATPIKSVTTTRLGDKVRMVVTPHGLWEHNAYQSDTQFVLEVRPLKEDPNRLVQSTRPGYNGEKLSLNFQNVDVRAVLQVIADFTNLNIITSDTVSGNLTLRLKDVPWDQALDIILQAKGLDKRKNGNVIWIAPRDELAARDKLALEAQAQIADLEPLQTEVFQLNYHRAKSVFEIFKDKEKTMLSKRGSVIMDERTNKLFVTDVGTRLDDLRRLISEIDVPVRQVLIEARIVEAEDNFSRNLGTRLGIGSTAGQSIINPARVDGDGTINDDDGPLLLRRATLGGNLLDTGFFAGQIEDRPDFLRDALGVNLPASAIGGRQVGQFSFVLYNSDFARFLNLEISALEQDGRGKVISSPRVVTSDQNEALIESGIEIPYQQATSSGATSISFRKANLALKVKPQITPDGRIMMKLDVNKDTPDPTIIVGGTGVAINTKHVSTDVLVENGGTLVIGGIYQQDIRNTVTKIPLLGDLPYVGALFRNRERRDNKTELLVFITPKVISEALTMR